MNEVLSNDVVVPSSGTRCLKKNGVEYFLLLNETLFSCSRINRSAAEIISLCNGVNTLEDISKILSEKYKVELERVKKDVKQTLDTLLSLGLLVKVGEEERSPREDFSISRGPGEIWLFVTNRCNLRCTTCFKNAGVEKSNELSYDEIRKFIDEIITVFRPRMIISGGEPLLRRDLNKILSYLKDKGLYVHLTTNGTLIDKNIVEEWRSIGIDFVQISLDGSKPEINDAIRGNGVFSARAARFAPVGRGSVNKDQLSPRAEDYIQLISNLINERKTMLRFKNLIGFESKLDRVPGNLTRKLNCGLGTVTISIDSDGSVYPCHWLHLTEYRAGNIRTNSFREIYFGSEILKNLRRLRVDQLECCLGCPWRYLCGGGCRALALFSTGLLTGADPYCKFYKFYFEHALWGNWV